MQQRKSYDVPGSPLSKEKAIDVDKDIQYIKKWGTILNRLPKCNEEQLKINLAYAAKCNRGLSDFPELCTRLGND